MAGALCAAAIERIIGASTGIDEEALSSARVEAVTLRVKASSLGNGRRKRFSRFAIGFLWQEIFRNAKRVALGIAARTDCRDSGD